MNQETLWQAYDKLPTDAKQIVDELITFLASRYQSIQVKSHKRLPAKKEVSPKNHSLARGKIEKT